ncbi:MULTISPECIES: alpha/beta hydrolase [unclassified Leifsonia]|uniref:alpha/beta hydrolase n=1 Tax=unclassified Leifsonia TaxID=2663824 RepID=UPI0006F80619|nr:MULTISPECIES: alpha/beta hydrolase family protein [unclassified Leifsonia]KQX07965.1 esterase [Leifsonia sp. Root1293]KRA12246.1 esterase [Leifsonia sp. Root60]
MALMQCSFFSDALGVQTHANVILPQEVSLAGERMPVLYLLHGRSDDETAWLRWTAIERYATEHGIAVVMPNAGRSFYTDQVTGYDYFTFISDELPRVMQGFFPLSAEPEDTFVAGLSMGGYGALKWALNKPHTVAAAASLSGAVDIAARDQDAEWLANHGSIGQAQAKGDDLLALVAATPTDASSLPPLFVWCGTEDALIEENRRFRAAADAAGAHLSYSEGPGGHDWARWDEQIQRVLEWLPVRGR